MYCIGSMLCTIRSQETCHFINLIVRQTDYLSYDNCINCKCIHFLMAQIIELET